MDKTNKVQQAETSSSACPVCKGTKTVQGPNGPVTCYACRGLGTIKGQLHTK